MPQEQKEKEELEFNLLEDKPLEDNNGSDYFGHEDIAKSLISVIKKAPRPFNIGLYGQWGVGKSTVCKLIEKELKSEDKYKVIYFDTWKYERDSFRRQFLITLDEELGLNLKYKEKLNQSISIPFGLDWKENIKLVIGDFLFRSLIFTIILLIVLVLLKNLVIPFIISNDYIVLSKKLVDFGIISTILSFIINSIKQYFGQKTISKTDSADGFADRFKEVLEKTKNKNLIIIVDNLDRLSSKKAINLLSDIKTFLSDEKYTYNNQEIKNNTLFIIPCDNKAINDQLMDIYGDDFNTEEYLRKFFNHSIQIPKFLGVELDNLIINKLSDTKISEFKDNYDLVFILSYAFRNNPREIIQFINSLSSLYLLAKERKINRITERDHISFLAKILVIRTKWPRIYEIIEDKILRTGYGLVDIFNKYIFVSEKDKTKKENKDLNDFLVYTENILDEGNEDVYFSIRQSDEQKQLPEWNSFILSADEGREDDVKNIYNNIKQNGKIKILGKLLNEYSKCNRHNYNLVFNIFKNTISNIEADDVVYFQEFILVSFRIITNLSVGRPELETIKKSDSLLKIFGDGINNFSSISIKEELCSHIVKLIKFIGSSKIERSDMLNVCQIFEITTKENGKNIYSKHNKNIIDSKRMFISNLKCTELFPESLIDKSSYKKILEDILKTIVDFDPIGSEIYEATLTFFADLLQWPQITNSEESRLLVLRKSLEFIEKCKIPKENSQQLENAFRSFTTRISTWYQSNPSSPEQKSLCIKIFKLIDLDINPNKDPQNYLNGYISSTSTDADSIINDLGTDYITNNIKARSSLITRTRNNNLDLIEKIKTIELSDEEKANIFSSLFGNKENVLRFLELTNHSIPNEYNNDKDFLKRLITQMINMIDRNYFSDLNFIEKWLNSIVKLGIKSDQIDSLVQKLRIVKDMADDPKKVVTEFVSSNISIFGDLITQEFKEM